jgi:hypothetical protein
MYKEALSLFNALVRVQFSSLYIRCGPTLAGELRAAVIELLALFAKMKYESLHFILELIKCEVYVLWEVCTLSQVSSNSYVFASPKILKIISDLKVLSVTVKIYVFCGITLLTA